MATTFQSLGLEKLSPVEKITLIDDHSEELEAEGAHRRGSPPCSAKNSGGESPTWMPTRTIRFLGPT